MSLNNKYFFFAAITVALLSISGCANYDAEPPISLPNGSTASVYISGQVTDGANGIAGIQIKIPNYNQRALTNAKGYFYLTVHNVNIGNYPSRQVLIDITDIDGYENGGYYNNKRLTMPVLIAVDGWVEFDELEIELERYPDPE